MAGWRKGFGSGTVTRKECPHEVGNELVAGPIAAADRIPGASAARNRDAVTIDVGRKERLAIGGGDQFGATLRVRIRIAAAHGLVFAISPDPLAVRIALVTGDIDHDARLFQLPQRLQNDERSP